MGVPEKYLDMLGEIYYMDIHISTKMYSPYGGTQWDIQPQSNLSHELRVITGMLISPTP
jgi:hypothetical protein